MKLLEMIERVQADFPNYKTGQLINDINRHMQQFVFETYLNKREVDLKEQPLMTEEYKEIYDENGDTFNISYDGVSYPIPTDCSRITDLQLPDDRTPVWYEIANGTISFFSQDSRLDEYGYEPVGRIIATYWAYPIVMSEPTDEPPFPSMLHEAVLALVLRPMYLKNQNTPMFQYYSSEYARLRREAKRYGSRGADGTTLVVKTTDRRYHNAKDH